MAVKSVPASLFFPSRQMSSLRPSIPTIISWEAKMEQLQIGSRS